MKKNYQDKQWMQKYIREYFIGKCDQLDIESPRPQWEEERVFYRQWLYLAGMEAFPIIEAKDLLSRMESIKDDYGTHFEYAINQIHQWIEENSKF